MLEIHLDAKTEAQILQYSAISGQKIEEIITAALLEFIPSSRDVCPPECMGEPNQESIDAMDAMARGEYKSFDSVEALMADLHAED